MGAPLPHAFHAASHRIQPGRLEDSHPENQRSCGVLTSPDSTWQAVLRFVIQAKNARGKALALLLDPATAAIVSGLVVVLLMTYLITSADSAILIVNTINGAGDNEGSRRYHILFWGTALAFVVGSMLILGGIEAIRITMIIGALPFSLVLAAMCASIIKAVVFDLIRKKHGVPTTAQACEDWDGEVTTS